MIFREFDRHFAGDVWPSYDHPLFVTLLFLVMVVEVDDLGNGVHHNRGPPQILCTHCEQVEATPITMGLYMRAEFVPFFWQMSGRLRLLCTALSHAKRRSQLISALPLRKLRQGSLLPLDTACSICLENYEAGDVLRVIEPCGHGTFLQCTMNIPSRMRCSRVVW